MMNVLKLFQQKQPSNEQAMALIAQMKDAALPMFGELKKMEAEGLAEVSDAVFKRTHIPEERGQPSLELRSKAYTSQAFYLIRVTKNNKAPIGGRREILIEFCENGMLSCTSSMTKDQSYIRSFASSLRQVNLGLFGIGAIQPQRIAANTDKILKFVVDELNHT